MYVCMYVCMYVRTYVSELYLSLPLSSLSLSLPLCFFNVLILSFFPSIQLFLSINLFVCLLLPIPPTLRRFNYKPFRFISFTTEAPKPCSSSPCKNGATCKELGGQKYECECKAGFGGANCAGVFILVT